MSNATTDYSPVELAHFWVKPRIKKGQAETFTSYLYGSEGQHIQNRTKSDWFIMSNQGFIKVKRILLKIGMKFKKIQNFDQYFFRV